MQAALHWVQGSDLSPAHLSFNEPHSTGHLKSTGRHTDTVDGAELKMAEGKVARANTTAVQNFTPATVFKGHNY